MRKNVLPPVGALPVSAYEQAQHDFSKWALIFIIPVSVFIEKDATFMSVQIDIAYALALMPFLFTLVALKSPLLKKDATSTKIWLCCILPGLAAVFAVPFTWAITLSVAMVAVSWPFYLIFGADKETIDRIIEPLMHYWAIPFGDGLFVLLNWGFALLGLRIAKLLPKEFGAGRWRTVFMMYGAGMLTAALLGLLRFLQPYVGYSAKLAGQFIIFTVLLVAFFLMRELAKSWFPPEEKQVAVTE